MSPTRLDFVGYFFLILGIVICFLHIVLVHTREEKSLDCQRRHQEEDDSNRHPDV